MALSRGTELSPSARSLLVKLCGMLASDFESERAAAALHVSRLLHREGLNWEELVPAEDAPAPAPVASRRYIDWRADLACCRRHHAWLNEVELNVLDTFSGQPTCLSYAQACRLAEVAAALRRRMRVAH